MVKKASPPQREIPRVVNPSSGRRVGCAGGFSSSLSLLCSLLSHAPSSKPGRYAGYSDAGGVLRSWFLTEMTDLLGVAARLWRDCGEKSRRLGSKVSGDLIFSLQNMRLF
ncbi:hypothetical protein Bca4012_042619 [Brassica carinata]